MVTIRAMTEADWPHVARIYGDGLATRLASFETTVPAWEEWDASHLQAPRFVAESEGAVVGWIAASPVSRRTCYRGVVEHSVYVAGGQGRRGSGRALLEALVSAAPGYGIWTIQTAVMAGNDASLALHRACGFREVGRRERIAQRDGLWHDTILLEIRLAGTAVSGPLSAEEGSTEAEPR